MFKTIVSAADFAVQSVLSSITLVIKGYPCPSMAWLGPPVELAKTSVLCCALGWDPAIYCTSDSTDAQANPAPNCQATVEKGKLRNPGTASRAGKKGVVCFVVGPHLVVLNPGSELRKITSGGELKGSIWGTRVTNFM